MYASNGQTVLNPHGLATWQVCGLCGVAAADLEACVCNASEFRIGPNEATNLSDAVGFALITGILLMKSTTTTSSCSRDQVYGYTDYH